MADSAISGLSAVTTPLATTEELAIVQSSTTKKATVAEIFGSVTSLTSDTLDGTEEVLVIDAGTAKKVTAQDVADLATGSNLGSANLTSSAATRTFKMAGNASTDYLEFQSNAGSAILKLRGDQAAQFTGIVGVGVAPNTNQPLYASSSTHSRTAYFVNTAVNGAAFYAINTVNNNAYGLKAFATGAGGTGGRYAADLDASGGSLNYALYIRGGDIWLGNATNGHKIGTATTQKFAFWGSTPVVQQNTTGTTAGFTAGVGTSVNDDSTFTGNTGSTAYTIGDIVNILKTIGLIAS